MEVAVYTKEGKDTGRKITLDDGIFDIEPSQHAIYMDVKQFLANQRQGTHKSKDKGEITGSTKKLKRQKGTGTARAGSIKSGIFKGGGRFHGPRPRDYSFKVNKKMKRLARKSALSFKAKSEILKVLEDFTFEKPRTKDYIAMLKALEINGKNLLVTAKTDANVHLSARNLKKTKVVTVDTLTTYDIVHADAVLISEGAVNKLVEILNA